MNAQGRASFQGFTRMLERCAQNIDTDQIIPAEYLTLVPSKVRRTAYRPEATACLLCQLQVGLLWESSQARVRWRVRSRRSTRSLGAMP